MTVFPANDHIIGEGVKLSPNPPTLPVVVGSGDRGRGGLFFDRLCTGKQHFPFNFSGIVGDSLNLYAWGGAGCTGRSLFCLR